MLSAPFPDLIKNPIVEAVAQFRFNSSEPAFTNLEAIGKILALPKKEEIRQISISHKADGTPEFTDTIEGYRFSSEHGDLVVVLMKDSFSHSFVGKYQGWDQFLASFKKNWDLCKPLIKPVNVNRIGLRFINRIMVPASLEKVSEYFRLAGTIDTHSTSIVPDEYFYRVGMPIPVPDGRAIVAHIADTRAPDDIGIPIIFDIDTFVSRDYKPDMPELWSILGVLRDQKNLIFFNTLTDKGITLFR